MDIVQLRDKEMPGSALLELAKQLRKVVVGRALLLINERADVALAAGADGVQLGEVSAYPPARFATIMGNESHHRAFRSFGIWALVQHQNRARTFLLVGTMFASDSHPGEEPSGPGLLSRIVSAGVSIPMLGIGGVDRI